MTKDEQVVHKDEVSEETESNKAETEVKEEKVEEKTEEKAEPQFLTKEEALALISEEREKIKQSSRDISRNEIEEALRRAELAERTLAEYEGTFENDPDKAELAKYRAKEKAETVVGAGAQKRQALDAFDKSFRNSLTQFITQAGVDPSDKRIDWAEEVQGDYLAKQSRILASVAKLQADEKKAADEKLEQRIKDLEARISEEANSVNTATAGGSGDDLKSAKSKMKAGWEELHK
jgi:hypothetical protein